MPTPFTWRDYQREDLARAALVDGAVLSWEQGLGKTLAAFALPLLKGTHANLVVAPGGLHEQLAAEAREKFGIVLRPLLSQEDFYADPWLVARSLGLDPGGEAPRYYLTHYTALGLNGADERGPSERKGKPFTPQNVTRLRAQTGDALGDPFASHPAHPAWRCVGETRGGITCVHRPSLSTLVADAFDCVVVDEATRIKGDDSYVALGVRQLRPRCRYVLTGTPVKNRLTDLFWLAHWAAGSSDTPTARWPYGNSLDDKAAFAAEHLVSERNLTREARAAAEGKRRPGPRQTNQICNLHRLWKLLAPVVLRRRKVDVAGADLVDKHVIPLRVQAGAAQRRAYHWHLSHPPKYTAEGEPMAPLASAAAQLVRLRQSALCPDADGVAVDPESSPWTPKNAAVLQVVRECLQRREPVVIFSAFQHYSCWLTDTLVRAGVSAICLDGNVKPDERGRLAEEFKAGRHAVLVAGLKSMGEGYSFDRCPNLILPSLEWAYDTNAQAVERVHRLTSRQDVRIYTVVTEGTIDERLAALFNEKSDASDLALDGALFKAKTEEVNLMELLRRALDDFDPDAPTLPETAIRAEWRDHLREDLAAAHATWEQDGAKNADRSADSMDTTPKPQPAAPTNIIPFPATTGIPPQGADLPAAPPPRRRPAATLLFPTRTGQLAALNP